MRINKYTIVNIDKIKSLFLYKVEKDIILYIRELL